MTDTKAFARDFPQLVSIGCVNIDVICHVVTLPTRGQRMMSGGITPQLGGMSTNVACAAARLDGNWKVNVDLIATVGVDDGAQWLQQQLIRYGVAVTGLVSDSHSHTSQCIIFVEPDGERTIVSEPTRINVEKVKHRLELSPSHNGRRHAHVDGHHAGSIAHLLKEARHRGWCTSLDTDELPESMYSQDEFRHLMHAFDIVFINRTCAKVLTNEYDVALMSASLSDWAFKTQTMFVLTLGADGVCVIEPDSQLTNVSSLAIDSVDTTGAGDVFAGVFLCCWLNGDTAVQAARYACVGGALATRASGALASLPTTQAIVDHCS